MYQPTDMLRLVLERAEQFGQGGGGVGDTGGHVLA